MNRLYLFVFIAIVGAVSMSCDNDVDLFGEITEMPVVYGLLSSSDTVQYIRVERSFADPETGANILAQDPDVVYYENVDVVLVDTINNIRYPLNRVNAVDEGYVRDEGDFVTDPNYLYKIQSTELDLTPGEVYRLEVIKDDEVIANANAIVLDDSRFIQPRTILGVRRISFQNGDFTTIRWERVDNASNYAISFDMVIRERNIQTGDQALINLRWDATTLIRDVGGSGETQEELLDGQGFFDFMQATFDPEENINRQFINMDVRLTSYGQAVGQYLDVINANSGITSAQEVPTFTNVNDGLGLFSSVNETMLEDLSPTSATLDSLYYGSTTGDLNFTP